MIILSIDSAASTVGVGVIRDGTPLGEHLVYAARGASRYFPSAVDELLHRLQLRREDVQGLAVTTGPGSFTGLRISCAWAAAWGFAEPHLELYGVGSLEALVAGQPLAPGDWAVGALDARGGAVYAALFERTGESSNTPSVGLTVHRTPQRLLPQDMLESCWRHLPPEARLWWIGAGEVSVGQEDHHRLIRIPHREIRPLAVARLGWQCHLRGERTDPVLLNPNYYRSTEAERSRS